MAIPLIIALAIVYVLGILTSLSVLISLLYFCTIPQHDKDAIEAAPEQKKDGDSVIDEPKPSSLLSVSRNDDVAAGYFAVCREFIQGGVNVTPSSRKHAGQESVSVYQNLYRNMRKKAENSQEQASPTKTAENVFFVVMRHGHLMLFDNAQQIDVRQVIPLASFDICVRGDHDFVSEGELWIKRNCICLSRKLSPSKEDNNRSSYFLYSNNCSEKEDFYHALLVNQFKSSNNQGSQPQPQLFETEHMIKLIRQLHASEDNVQTRWLNALTGRIFLALYKTSHVEELVKAKIMKKISRVAKPTFISSLSLKAIELGDSAPTFVRLRLKEMGVDGALMLETDVKYTGQFKAVIAATARIDLGQRFKPREVDLVLAGVLKRLEGHLLIHIKPPPSNRVWISFETMPKIKLSLEPIVSSRQITFGYILTAIERRIMEVINDTIVYPNWDDIPFLDTSENEHRGGIWTESNEAHVPSPEDSASAIAPNTTSSTVATPSAPASAIPEESVSTVQGSSTLATADNGPSRRPQAGPVETLAADSAFLGETSVGTSVENRGPRQPHDIANSAVQSLHNVVEGSLETHDVPSDTASSPTRALVMDAKAQPVPDSSSGEDTSRQMDGLTNIVDVRNADETSARNRFSYAEGQEQEVWGFEDSLITEQRNDRADQDPSATPSPLNKRILNATTAARKWGTDFLQRQHDGLMRPNVIDRPQEPVGRGSPLPPPGQPLPGPASRAWNTPALRSIKRKSISTSTLPSAESHTFGKD